MSFQDSSVTLLKSATAFRERFNMRYCSRNAVALLSFILIFTKNMDEVQKVIARLKDEHRLNSLEYKQLLLDDNTETRDLLRTEARKAALSVFGNGIFVRGLMEIGNHCRNNCLYCGIRAGNAKVRRYRLDREEILDCCHRGYKMGFRTFVLQGGEDPDRSDDWLEDLIRAIKAAYPDCAVTLSLGERSEESYSRLREAGADRYLLRHETFNPEHYARLHPAGMSRDRRLECIAALKRLGYQTGTGIMVGSPWQTIDNIVEDLLYIQDLRPEMIGIGPFVHHRDTPLGDMPDGSMEMCTKLISIFRLMDPQALIPATTALATLDPDGRKKGILAGANVVMPNLSPAAVRRDYSLYEGKASEGAESAEGLDELRKELQGMGYNIVVGRGDYGCGENVDKKCTT